MSKHLRPNDTEFPSEFFGTSSCRTKTSQRFHFAWKGKKMKRQFVLAITIMFMIGCKGQSSDLQFVESQDKTIISERDALENTERQVGSCGIYVGDEASNLRLLPWVGTEREYFCATNVDLFQCDIESDPIVYVKFFNRVKPALNHKIKAFVGASNCPQNINIEEDGEL